jgi:hypothetical protein
MKATEVKKRSRCSEVSRKLQEESIPVDTASKWTTLLKSTVAMFLAGTMIPMIAFAVSGGGLDYANLDISNQDFSGGNYKGKDFTQGTNDLIPIKCICWIRVCDR